MDNTVVVDASKAPARGPVHCCLHREITRGNRFYKNSLSIPIFHVKNNTRKLHICMLIEMQWTLVALFPLEENCGEVGGEVQLSRACIK